MRSFVSNSLDEFGDLASAPSNSLGNGSIHGLFTVACLCRVLASAPAPPYRHHSRLHQKRCPLWVRGLDAGRADFPTLHVCAKAGRVPIGSLRHPTEPQHRFPFTVLRCANRQHRQIFLTEFATRD
jgi:hypothetical protein